MIDSTKMQPAQDVLTHVEKLSGKRNAFHLEAYANGREQGYAIANFDSTLPKYPRVAFAEYRNSDQIVVYFGTYHDFDMQGNTPSDKVYHDARFFAHDDARGAAKFIVKYLKTGVAE
jgi:hypothetical protein